MSARRALTAAVLLAPLAVAGCGGDDDGSGTASTSAPPATTAAADPAAASAEVQKFVSLATTVCQTVLGADPPAKPNPTKTETAAVGAARADRMAESLRRLPAPEPLRATVTGLADAYIALGVAYRSGTSAAARRQVRSLERKLSRDASAAQLAACGPRQG